MYHGKYYGKLGQFPMRLIFMVPLLDGNSENVAQSWISDFSRSNQMPLADQITEIAPYARNYS